MSHASVYRTPSSCSSREAVWSAFVPCTALPQMSFRSCEGDRSENFGQRRRAAQPTACVTARFKPHCTHPSSAVPPARCRLPDAHARLASDRWSGATGPAFHPQGFDEKRQICLLHLILLSQASCRNGIDRRALAGLPVAASRPGAGSAVAERCKPSPPKRPGREPLLAAHVPIHIPPRPNDSLEMSRAKGPGLVAARRVGWRS